MYVEKDIKGNIITEPNAPQSELEKIDVKFNSQSDQHVSIGQKSIECVKQSSNDISNPPDIEMKFEN